MPEVHAAPAALRTVPWQDPPWALGIQPGSYVAVVGAGGKSTLIRLLAAELERRAQPVLITTTTHLGDRQFPGATLLIGKPSAAVRLAAELGRGTIVYAPGWSRPGRLQGMEPPVADDLRAALPKRWVMLVEADGARRRWLKAPAEHEPAWPPGASHAIAVVGLRALGQPVDEERVFRSHEVRRLTGSAVVTPAVMAQLAVHPEGCFKGVPAQARRWVGLSQLARGRSRLALSASHALGVAGGPPAFAFSRAQVAAAPPAPIGCVLLAAGPGRRLGGGKLLQPLGGRPLLQWAIDAVAASPFHPVLAVLGDRADEVRAAVSWGRVRPIVCPRWEEGQSSSLRAGVAALPASVAGVAVMLGDLPATRVSTMAALASAWTAHSGKQIVAPRHDGRPGHPVLFPRDRFADLLSLRGDEGGRRLLGAQRGVAWVTVDDPGIGSDADLHSDLEALRAQVRRGWLRPAQA